MVEQDEPCMASENSSKCGLGKELTLYQSHHLEALGFRKELQEVEEQARLLKVLNMLGRLRMVSPIRVTLKVVGVRHESKVEGEEK
ncbi:conserved hypothetical protein [Ricinus communis]|uniref:Uncharacterized protein n=1 Tax=Ricinus communis TaxID=3988 RepID=B9SU96_RICCO|nr:conserved hypothetical protein [Ricinus communis]